MESNDVFVGTLVENPSVPEWGPGRVVDVRGDTAHVFFRDLEDHRAKRFKADRLRLAEVQSDPILDNLPAFNEKSGELGLSTRRVTVDQAKAKFLGRYPGGFHDAGYLGDLKRGERADKWRGHEMWLKELGDGKAEELLSDGAIGELNKRANRIAGASNLLTAAEAAAFKEGLAVHDTAEAYFRALFEMLQTGPTQETFEPCATAVASWPEPDAKNADRWAATTVLPFLARPDVFMFVNPTLMLKASERLGFDVHYDARPNWKTYDAVLRMSRIYFDLLEDLHPRDLIDVQSFFLVTGGQAGKRKVTKRPKAGAVE
jgi:hypothetical protein